ncbi:MAG: helix-turn-helix domain-containing protein, partial [Halobacteria archaeon]|nr:helix-turn-helix domain-containing protein [Halobacteria archaeon]
MPFTLPSEIVVETFLPTFRALLAAELDERGMTQNEIAHHLGVSQPAVSKYVSNQVETEPRFSNDERMVETVERVADGITQDTITESEV